MLILRDSLLETHRFPRANTKHVFQVELASLEFGVQVLALDGLGLVVAGLGGVFYILSKVCVCVTMDTFVSIVGVSLHYGYLAEQACIAFFWSSTLPLCAPLLHFTNTENYYGNPHSHRPQVLPPYTHPAA